jgi:hypothetical protein
VKPQTVVIVTMVGLILVLAATLSTIAIAVR